MMMFLEDLYTFLSRTTLNEEQKNILHKYASNKVQTSKTINNIEDNEILRILSPQLLNSYIELLNRHIRRDLVEPMDDIELYEAGVH